MAPSTRSIVYRSPPSTAEEVLDQMSSPHAGGLYAFGYKHRRISLVSQQIRALNFVWAISKLGRAQPGQTMLVVGAGIGGLTTAIAAAQKGLRVRVVDHADAWMGHLRFATHRYIHPNMLSWPEADWDNPVAELPILSWHAMRGDRLWAYLQGKVDRYIRSLGGGGAAGNGAGQLERPRVCSDLVITRSEPGWKAAWSGEEGLVFDHVVLALGPGHEPTAFGSRRYWDQDERALDRARAERRVLISGTGDGGLIDVLRLALFEPRKQRPVAHIELIQRLHGALNRLDMSNLNELELFCRQNPEAIRTLDAFLDEHQRNAPEIHLQSPSGELPVLGVAFLHRLLVHLLNRKGRVQIHPGKLSIGDLESQHRLREPRNQPAVGAEGGPPPVNDHHWKRSGCDTQYDEVFVRHGTENPLPAFLADSVRCEIEGFREDIEERALHRGDDRPPDRLYGRSFGEARGELSWDPSEWPVRLGDLWCATRAVLGRDGSSGARRTPDSDKILQSPDRLTWLVASLGLRDETQESDENVEMVHHSLVRALGGVVGRVVREAMSGRADQPMRRWLNHLDTRGSLCDPSLGLLIPPPLSAAGPTLLDPSTVHKVRFRVAWAYELEDSDTVLVTPSSAKDAQGIEVAVMREGAEGESLLYVRRGPTGVHVFGRWIRPFRLEVGELCIVDVVLARRRPGSSSPADVRLRGARVAVIHGDRPWSGDRLLAALPRLGVDLVLCLSPCDRGDGKRHVANLRDSGIAALYLGSGWMEPAGLVRVGGALRFDGLRHEADT